MTTGSRPDFSQFSLPKYMRPATSQSRLQSWQCGGSSGRVCRDTNFPERNLYPSEWMVEEEKQAMIEGQTEGENDDAMILRVKLRLNFNSEGETSAEVQVVPAVMAREERAAALWQRQLDLPAKEKEAVKIARVRETQGYEAQTMAMVAVAVCLFLCLAVLVRRRWQAIGRGRESAILLESERVAVVPSIEGEGETDVSFSFCTDSPLSVNTLVDQSFATLSPAPMPTPVCARVPVAMSAQDVGDVSASVSLSLCMDNEEVHVCIDAGREGLSPAVMGETERVCAPVCASHSPDVLFEDIYDRVSPPPLLLNPMCVSASLFPESLSPSATVSLSSCYREGERDGEAVDSPLTTEGLGDERDCDDYGEDWEASSEGERDAEGESVLDDSASLVSALTLNTLSSLRPSLSLALAPVSATSVKATHIDTFTDVEVVLPQSLSPPFKDADAHTVDALSLSQFFACPHAQTDNERSFSYLLQPSVCDTHYEGESSDALTPGRTLRATALSPPPSGDRDSERERRFGHHFAMQRPAVTSMRASLLSPGSSGSAFVSPNVRGRESLSLSPKPFPSISERERERDDDESTAVPPPVSLSDSLSVDTQSLGGRTNNGSSRGTSIPVYVKRLGLQTVQFSPSKKAAVDGVALQSPFSPPAKAGSVSGTMYSPSALIRRK